MICSTKTVPRISWFLATLSICLMLSSCWTDGEIEHLEHATPEHKPTSYTAAVVELEQRITEVMNEKLNEHDRTQRLAELGDMIRWLPEIAAESDLKKSEWDEVVQISQRLTAWHTTLLQSRHASSEQHRQIAYELLALTTFSRRSDQFQARPSQVDHD